MLDFTAIFGNPRPVEIEVGSGKGLFLVTAGQANPETNYLGIEIVRKYQLYTATRLAKRQLTNVRAASPRTTPVRSSPASRAGSAVRCLRCQP